MLPILEREVLLKVCHSFLPLLIVPLATFTLLGCGGGSSSGSGGGHNPCITIAPAPSQIGAGANWQFSATVTGASGNQTVNWSINPSTAGSIDSTGLYIAPTTGTFPQTVTVTAASQTSSSLSASDSVTVTQMDPLGTAQGSQITCPQFGGGLPASSSSCYQINTSCPGAADFSAYLKVNQPTGTPLGTVLFGTGTGGTSLYDYDVP